MAMLNTESKSAYTCTALLELKGLGLNSGLALENRFSVRRIGKKVC